MKAIDIKGLHSIGMEKYYHELWGRMESDEEYSEPRSELLSTPEEDLPEAELNDALSALDDEQSARIVEAIGQRSQYEVERSVLDPAGEQFLKGCLKEYVRTHGTFVSDPELASIIKSFSK